MVGFGGFGLWVLGFGFWVLGFGGFGLLWGKGLGLGLGNKGLRTLVWVLVV